MLSRFRHIFGVVFFLLVASCSGGGCSSGCGGCGGTTPLPGGYPKDKAIENAASVRVSRPGLDFVEKSLPAVVTKAVTAPGGKLTFEIPTIPINQPDVIDLGILGGIDLVGSVCPGGADPKATPPRCVAEVNIGAATFQIDSIKPNAINLRATLPLQLDDTPIAADLNPGPAVTLHVGYGANGTCIGPSSERPSVNPKPLPIAITIPLIEETTAPRAGYTKIDIDNAVVNLDAISGDDVRICADCGPLSFSILGQNVNLCNPVLNLGFIKNLLVGQLKGGLQSQVKNLLADQLCTKPVPTLNPPCPTGSKPNAANDKCVFNSDANKCVSMLLGTDAHIDLGGFLKSISPGTAGGLDFGLAANGAMKPFPNADAVAGRTPNGVTLGMIGGVTAQPPSKCVPQAALKLPTGIPIPDELAPTANDPQTAPHVGIALAGRFLDYSMGSVYNSGLLCLGVSSEQFDMLRAGLLSLLVPSLKSLTFQQGDAAAAISTRPQAPPTVKLGGGTDINKDPLIAITLPKFALDFYLWHQERFTRVFTFEADLTIPVNLQTGKDPVKNPNGGILPALGDIKVANGKVTNADLLMDEPALVAAALQGLLGSVSKQLVGGGFSPIDLSGATSSLGLNLEISQIKKLTKGTDDYVGIFANLSKAAGTATVEADTKAVLVSKKVDVTKMGLSTMDRASRPELVVDLSSSLDDGRRTIEYSWWIDSGTRSIWSTEKHVTISDDGLFLQGKHVLKIVSRIAGQPETEDASPAEIPFTIDAVAPFARVERSSSGSFASLEAWDIVTSKENLVARFRLDSAAFGEWRPLADLARIEVGNASVLEAEVKDEEGNVRSVTQELIRGKADGSLSTAGSGCNCSTTPGEKDTKGGTLALLLGVLGLGAIALRRRNAGARLRHSAFAVVSIGAVAATSQGCGCGSEDDPQGTLCGKSCQEECKPTLQQGRPGTYMSLAKAGDGAIWVAGYNEALIFEGDNQLFGDLVVGKYDLGKQKVEWTTVDGLPARTEADGCADRAKDSWRNGESDSGDDVGLYTSIQVSASGKPIVSYYDLTHKALKLAYNEDGTWKSFTVRQVPGSDVGRYGKMVLDGGKPVIAFLQTETGNGGKLRSKVVVARAKSEIPHEPGDFTFEDAAVEEGNPCTGDSCGAGACLKDTGACAPKVGGCTPADCGTGKACVTQDNKATCVNVQGTLETYANVFGARIAFAASGSTLGLAVYDRPHGNLVALVNRGGGKWDRVIVDGETGSRADKTAIDTGDVGIAPSIAIDGSTWHLSYVSGLDETLRYVTFAGDKPGKPEIVDDGSTADGKPFADGKHIVGDDSFIRYQGDVVTVVYQDATAGTLRRATGTKSGATRKWDVRTLQQPGKFGGFYPVIVPGEDKVANFWETAERSSKNFNGDVSIVAP